MLAKLDALDDRLLFAPGGEEARAFVAAVRLSLRAGSIRCDAVRPLERLLHLHGIGDRPTGEGPPPEESRER